MSCDRAPDFLGAYVLGALEPTEREAAEEHLRDCPACAAELDEFRGLTARLDLVRPEDLHPEAPSPELYARVAAAAGRRGRRARRWIAAAAAAVLIGAGGVTWASVQGEDGQVRTATAGGLEMSVVATERNDGTALDITVAGLRRGQQCRLLVLDDAGDPHQAGEWTVPGGPVTYDIWTEVDPGSLADVVLFGDSDAELLRVSF